MSVITVGDFDGVHLGHRFLLRQVVHAAQVLGVPSIAVTFDRNTKAFLKGTAPGFLTDNEERRSLLLSEGIDTVCILPFDDEFHRMSAEDFLMFLRERYGCTDLFGGEDFRFGAGGAGTLTEGVQVSGIRQHVVSLKRDLVKISSTSIRMALSDGLVEQANTWLGYPYSVSGTVQQGKHLGRTIGFPTVNLAAEEGKILPRNGVYVTDTTVDGVTYPSMTNVGVRPTVESGSGRNVETHLLDADGDYYEKRITVRFLARLREERRFSDLGELMQQLRSDREKALSVHRSLPIL